jgi:BirA family biotin operon repressor/biotin-[acetyl-CoA-carboxylase] ligase
MSTSAAIIGHEISLLDCEGWHVRVFDELPSTNTFAARLPKWNAIRAVRQTAGRGRTADRHWVSDDGGLWLSAVLPCPGSRPKWAMLPLAAGWAVLEALREFGVAGARLRWPNDVMIGRRKLAGLLVERFTADTAVVGLGMNIFNHPEETAVSLDGVVAHLADLVPGAYTVDDVSRLMLRGLRRMHAILLNAGFHAIADELNIAWEKPRRVELTLNGRGQTFDGLFQGIDHHGRLRLLTDRHGRRHYDATDVALLRELE